GALLEDEEALPVVPQRILLRRQNFASRPTRRSSDLLARLEALLEDEEALPVVPQRILLRRKNFAGRPHGRMVRFDRHLEERAAGGRPVRFARLEDGGVAAGHRAAPAPCPRLRLPERS